VIGRFVYIIGGLSFVVAGPSMVQRSVARAPIQSDGSLGSFALVPDVNLITARFGHRSVVIGKYLYVLGGSVNLNGDPVASIERALINSGGSLGSFESISTALRTPGVASSMIVGNSLYVFTGGNGGIAQATLR